MLPVTICMSCGRRTDPNRSFCTRCGSAVFLDANDPSARRMLSSTTIDTSDDAVEPTGPTGPARQRQTSARPRQQAQRAREQMRAREAASVAGFGSALWGLIKFGIFLYLLYWGYTWVKNTPEVRGVIDQVQRDGDIKPALDYLRERFETLVVGSPAARESTADPEPANEPPRQPLLNAPLERATAGDKDVVEAPANAAPADPSLPRVVRRISPVYTTEARRAGIEGTVLLRAMIDEDGTVSNVSVLRSLDKEFGLDEQAMMALRQWIFDPPRRDGVPTRAVVQVQMNFTLR
jgi:TonB family protein